MSSMIEWDQKRPAESQPAGRAIGGRRGWAPRLRRLGGIALIFAVLFYAPLTFTYFLNPDAYAHRLQDHVLEFLVSPTFAFGAGSGYPDHIDTYAHTYAVMFSHTVAGSLAIVLGLTQFSTSLRRRVPAMHRLFGRIYLVCALIISGSAMAYLAQTPQDEVFSGAAFADLLWLLALATAAVTVAAVYAAMSRDIASHQALVALSFALLMSAALLRVGWIGMGQFWNESKWLLNLVTGVWAGPLLVTCAILYIRGARSDRGNGQDAALPRTPVIGVGVFAALGVLVLAPTLVLGDAGDQTILFWAFVPGFTVQLLGFGYMTLRSQRHGRPAAARAWRSYFLGVASTPGWMAIVLVIAHQLQGIELHYAWYAACSLGWSAGAVLGYIAHVLDTGTFWRRNRPASAPERVAAA